MVIHWHDWLRHQSANTSSQSLVQPRSSLLDHHSSLQRAPWFPGSGLWLYYYRPIASSFGPLASFARHGSPFIFSIKFDRKYLSYPNSWSSFYLKWYGRHLDIFAFRLEKHVPINRLSLIINPWFGNDPANNRHVVHSYGDEHEWWSWLWWRHIPHTIPYTRCWWVHNTQHQLTHRYHYHHVTKDDNSSWDSQVFSTRSAATLEKHHCSYLFFSFFSVHN